MYESLYVSWQRCGLGEYYTHLINHINVSCISFNTMEKLVSNRYAEELLFNITSLILFIDVPHRIYSTFHCQGKREQVEWEMSAPEPRAYTYITEMPFKQCKYYVDGIEYSNFSS